MTLTIVKSEIPEVLVIEPKVFGDDRGFFYESYNERAFGEALGFSVHFVQETIHARRATCCAACTTRSGSRKES